MTVLRIIKACKACGTEFSVPPSRSGTEHCSRACADATQAVGQITRTCPVCGREFSLPPSKSDRKCCSAACAAAARHNRPHPRGTYIGKTCPVCGKVFRVPPSMQHVICCSRACHLERVRGRPRHYTGESKARLTGRPRKSVDETRACPVCSAEFTVPSYERKVYCSRECAGEARRGAKRPSGRITKTCPVCGNEFQVYPSQVRVACCSRACAAARTRARQLESVRQMSEAEAVWFAGLFDGEGSIILTQRWRDPERTTAKITLSNTVKALLDRAREVTGVGNVTLFRRSEANPRHQDAYTWQVNGEKAREILRQIRPWLIAKAERADAVLAGESFPRQSRWDRYYPPEVTA